MLDGVLKRAIDRPLAAMGAFLAGRGVGADTVSAAGLVLGLAGAGAIANRAFAAGFVLILLSRLCDGLDGAVARHSRPSDLGGYLDIVFDFVFYGAVPLGFAFADPALNALPAAVLLASFYANGASFLAFAVMAQKRGLSEARRGPKSLYFTVGLAEASETLAVFLAACLFPAWFVPLAYGFAALTALTCVSRIRLAILSFREPK